MVVQLSAPEVSRRAGSSCRSVRACRSPGCAGTVDEVSETVVSTVRRGAPVERVDLDADSWVDVTRGFVTEADALYEHLVATVPFTRRELFRYDHRRPEPRLGAWFTPTNAPHPVLLDAQRTLQHRYGVRFDGAALAFYRDGSDRMAMHRDRDLRWLDDTVIALLILGQRRPFPLRPLTAKYDHEAPDGGATHDLRPGHGDLVVMGGASQRGWQHGVPPVDPRVGGRISVQWRWSSRRGRMERGGSYSKPLRFGRG